MRFRYTTAIVIKLCALFVPLGFTSCYKDRMITLSPQEITITGEAQEVFISSTMNITSLILIEDDQNESGILSFNPSMAPIQGDWYTVSVSSNRRTIKAAISENLSGNLRKLELSVSRYGIDFSSIITQLPL